MAVIMVDLDHFKEFNDAFGHAAGDALLREMGRHLRQSVRAKDIACRYGGEAFTFILCGAAPEIVMQRGEALRDGMRQLSVPNALRCC